MDGRIEKYLKELEQHLAGLPELERKEAVDYYTEYVNDALDEGVSPEELLSRLDSAEKAVAAIKAETGLKNVRSNPGLKNYSKLVRYARIGFTTPLTILMFSLLIFTTYSIAILLFLGTVVSAAAGCLILPVLVNEALKIPSGYTAEIIGTIGMGIFLAGLMLLTAYGFYVLCRPIFRLSANLISNMMKKDKSPMLSTDSSIDTPVSGGRERTSGKERTSGSKMSSGRMLKAGLIIIAASLLLMIVTGLPIKMFMIFNSMKPGNIDVQSREFTAGDVSRINISTTHSVIRLKEGSSDKIELVYEQSDWLESDISLNNGELVFKEASNGRMPLFPLVSMHENRAELTVSLPAGCHPDNISLESRGGFIYIETVPGAVEAKTYTGSIFMESPVKPAAQHLSGTIIARTSSGFIQVGGNKSGTKPENGKGYELSAESTENIVLETERGNIVIQQ